MSTQTEHGELAFSRDFAGRIIARADAIRRRRRVAGLAGIASLAIAIGTAGIFLVAPARQPAPAPTLVATTNDVFEPSRNAKTDPLQFLFPDAAPVAQFADNYSEMAYGREQGAGELLFADDTKDTDDL
jgi:hypothetical protein